MAEDPTASASKAAGPVGTGDRVVVSGECVISIAEETGHFWQKLWELPENEELRTLRKDPNVLLAGDRIHVPPIAPKEESVATEKRHRFRRKGVPSVLSVTCSILGEPLADQPFTLDVDGVIFTGRTDASGGVKQSIPCGARAAVLKVGIEPDLRVYELNLGGLDPIDTMTGQKARLNNLGYTAGSENTELTPEFEAALRAFQEDQKLAVSGKADRATLDKLNSLTC
jgi:hypothetical protein